MNTRVGKKNINWAEVMAKFLSFRKAWPIYFTNKKMTNSHLNKAFEEKMSVKIGRASFTKLKTNIVNHDKKMNEWSCPVCQESHAEIDAKYGTVMTPDTCKHPNCAICLAAIFIYNRTVKL